MRKLPRWKLILFSASALLTLAIISLAIWFWRLDQDISARFSQKRFAPPVEFYSAPERIRVRYQLEPTFLTKAAQTRRWRSRPFVSTESLRPGDNVQSGDFSVWNSIDCKSALSLLVSLPNEQWPELDSCFVFRNTDARSLASDLQLLALDKNHRVLGIFGGEPLAGKDEAQMEPEMFAQFYGEQPVLRRVVPLGEAPFLCLKGLLAIEDSQFLDHPGVSVTGLARAVITNLRYGRMAQGGSTITQQLVKNYFLTDEKTLKRKLTEFAMALLVEQRASKEEILETYINLIYMGQNGPFQVRGFAAASDHYFGTEFRDLNLEQCALLAAIVNSPGLFNPFNHPERALARRAKVLDRMMDLGLIEKAESERAKVSPLPSRPPRSLSEPAPYFVAGARKQLKELGISSEGGLRVFTSLNLRAQESAQRAIKGGLERLEKSHKNITQLAEKGKKLEAVLISADPLSGEVQAIVGGRNFLQSPFNRAVDSHRQVGSIMKPVVYLAALEARQENGDLFQPLSVIDDSSFTYKYEGQSWSPKNYDGTFNGKVPMFFGLKESLNAATASLGLQIGVGSVVDVARRLGITSKIEALPALTLGAFELYPWEVLQTYVAIARFGSRVPLSYIRQVTTLDLTPVDLFVFNPIPEVTVSADNTAILVGMMKQTLVTGTARAAKLIGFNQPAAGKTGTTNDKKDAWFAGFTPDHVAVVWIGYDDNTPHGLTGASGSVPIWADYMRQYAAWFPGEDFKWPETTEVGWVSSELQQSLGVPMEKGLPEPISLVFRKDALPPGVTKAPPSP